MKKLACIPPCSGVEKPKKYTLIWDQEVMTIFMLYLFNQMILPFHFISTMFVQNSFQFSITAITLSYDIAVLFKINNILPLWVTFYTLI